MLHFILGLKILFYFSDTPAPIFEAQVIDNNITIGYGLALGDVDGDGKPDILLADKKQFVWYRNGDWKRFVMIENLTEHDNVCITARDINGDGKVEVAVGGQWNPSETVNAEQSGSVHYLIRPDDPTQAWTAMKLHHEPTVHRMRWVRSSEGKYFLVVVPLHGRGNKGGEGEGVKVIAYEYPNIAKGKWPMTILDSSMHLTHNVEIAESVYAEKKGLYLAGKEGVRFIGDSYDKNATGKAAVLSGIERGAGEIRIGKISSVKNFIVTIEPMHGNEVVVYLNDDDSKRIVLDDNIKEGHALATADFDGSGSNQVVAGWRSSNREGKLGIKLYTSNIDGTQWKSQWIDENGMACEDLQVMDLNGDGKPDIVASGRATKNLKIYWNRTGK